MTRDDSTRSSFSGVHKTVVGETVFPEPVSGCLSGPADNRWADDDRVELTFAGMVALLNADNADTSTADRAERWLGDWGAS